MRSNVEAPRSPPPTAPVARAPSRGTAWDALAGSFRYAWYGVVETAVHQRNMRIHLVAALWVALLGCAVRLGTGERLALLLSVFLVLSAEVANSALEALVDLVTTERDERARIAKDAGAGGVLVVAVGSVAVLATVLAGSLPALREARAALQVQVAIGVPLTAVAIALLVGNRRAAAVDALLAAAGVLLVGAVAWRSVDAVFAAVAALVLVVAIAAARARRRR